MKHPHAALLLPLGALALLAAGLSNGDSRSRETGASPNSADAPPKSSSRPDTATDWRDVRRVSEHGGDPAFTERRGASEPWVASADPVTGDRSQVGVADRAPAGHGIPVSDEFVGLTLDEKIERLPEGFRERARRYRRELATMDPEYRRFICWKPGTSPEVVAAYQEIEREGGLGPGAVRAQARQFLGTGHWGTTYLDGPGNDVQGRPVTLTWSIVPDGTLTPDGGNTVSRNSALRERLAEIYGGDMVNSPSNQPWFSLFTDIFDRLGEETGINFVYQPLDDGEPVSNDNPGTNQRGDIRISGRVIDGEGGTLAFAYAPDFGDIVIDTGDSYFTSVADDSRNFFNTVTHEVGHALGLGHVCPVNETKLMEPFISNAYRGPQFDDIYSLQRQYGDFLETASGGTANDTVADAAELNITEGDIELRGRLSLDGEDDVDYFRFSAPAEHQIDITVNPLGETYLEGPQLASGCTGGESFSAGDRQDLNLTLLSGDGSEVLATAPAMPAGESEEIVTFPILEGGDFIIRVDGASADTAQLYELETFLESTLPQVEVALDESTLEAESNVPANQTVDPGETVRMNFTFLNTGEPTAPNLTARIEGPEGSEEFTDFTGSATLGDLAPGESVAWPVTFALGGDCGTSPELTLTLTAEGGFTTSFAVPLSFGEASAETLINESFELPFIPPDWDEELGTGPSWISSTEDAADGARAARVESPGNVGQSILQSPEVMLGDDGGLLSFSHSYSLENRFDGGVLEVSLDGGPWIDLPGAEEGVTVTGGYDNFISSDSGSPIGGRFAWTGGSGGFRTTTAELPDAWAGSTARFRWVLATDSSQGGGYWAVDAVTFSTETISCTPFRPGLFLSSETTRVFEGNPGDAIGASLHTMLPLNRDVTLTLQRSGDADPGDLASSLEVTLPAGQTQVAIPVEAPDDGVEEGEESLTLEIPGSSEDFAALSPASLSLTIDDPVDGFADWRLQYEGLSEDPSADDDGDGSGNLVEYAFGTNPLVGSDAPAISAVFTDTEVQLAVPDVQTPDDVVVGAETSVDLETWEETGVTETAAGFTVQRSGPMRYLRLKVEEQAP